jgi:YesN/AraC family two-component response regulator
MQANTITKADEEVLKSLSILYVEDEDLMRENMGMLLRRKVKHVFMAANGREGLDQFAAERPDIIITDIEMPVMNGLEMIDEIRKTDPTLPIVVITAFSDESHRSDKANARLLKPILKDDLFRTITDIFLNK